MSEARWAGSAFVTSGRVTPRVCHSGDGRVGAKESEGQRAATMSAAVSESQDIEQATAAIQCALSLLPALPLSSQQLQAARQQDQTIRSPTPVSPCLSQN